MEKSKKKKKEDAAIKNLSELAVDDKTHDLPAIPPEALRTLTPPEREVFIARYEDGLSWGEVSLRLGRPQATVKSVDQRLKKKVKGRLLSNGKQT